MKTFEAIQYNRQVILLSSPESIGDFYETVVKKEEDVIVKVGSQSFLVIGSPLATKIRNGEFYVGGGIETVLKEE